MSSQNNFAPSKQNWLVRQPLVSFFVLSYLFFWLLLIFFIAFVTGILHLSPAVIPAWAMVIISILGSWMPNLAATLVTRANEGREGVKTLFKKFFQFNFKKKWWLAALIPLALALLAGLINATTGSATGNTGLSPIFWLSLIGVNLITGATGEEAGWRGFALPRLQKKFSPLKASLILGLVWNFWHLPLWFTNGYQGIDLLIFIAAFSIGILSLSVLMTWVSNHTNGSLAPMVLLHFAFNAGLNLVDVRGLGLGQTLPLLVILCGLQMVVAVMVVLFGGMAGKKAKNTE